MNTLILLSIIIATIVIIVALRIKLKNRALGNTISILIVLVYLFFIFVGANYRFTPTSAAWANSFISSDDEWLDKVDFGDNQIHMFYDHDEELYRTVFVEKLIVGYRSNMASHSKPHHEDSIQSLGGINVTDDGRSYSAFLVKSTDSNVKYIGLLNESGELLETVSIGTYENVLLSYIYKGRETCFNCELVAFDKELNKVYYLGYEHGDNILSEDKYKWYKFR